MEVVFRTKRLQKNYEHSANAVRQWGPQAGRKYVTRIEQFYAAIEFPVIYSTRSLRAHALKGPRKDHISIYLTGRWRLIITKGQTEDSVVIEEVSNHYDD